MGSSMVMMWASSFSSLRMLRSEASVVVLPEPVGPTTSTKPRGLLIRFRTLFGIPICSIVSSLEGICRRTRAKLPFSLKALTRKRAISPKANPKSAPPFSRICWMWSSEVMERINSSVSSGRNGGPSTRWRMPWMRMTGGMFTRMCRSAPPSETINCNKSDIW